MADWDDSNLPQFKPSGRSELAMPGRTVWSDEQLMRLENEWRRLQRAFAYHPHVRVVPLQGDPPEQYQVEYRLRSLSMNKDSQLEYTTSCAVHIWLAPGFPHEPPLVRPVGAIFHPNMVPEGIKIDHAWTSPASTLADVVTSVGRMLAFQEYDTEVVWNDVAMEWITSNPDYVPVDAEADLSAEAGGDPLERVCKFGPRTLDQIRSQLKQMCDALLASEGGISLRELQNTCGKMRQSLSPFLEDDVPDELRKAASELDEWARQMPITYPTWEVVRRYRLAAESGLALTQQLRDLEKALVLELDAIDALVQSPPPESLDDLFKAIPPLAALQMHQGNLTNLMKRTEQAAMEVGNTVRRLSALPALTVKRCSGLVLKRLESDAGRAAVLATEASDRVQAAYNKVVPQLGRGKVHGPALKRFAEWREYADFLVRAGEFVKQITFWGPAGLQAFYIKTDKDELGPYELELPVAIGNQRIAVRNPASTILEIIDADSSAVLKRADTGSIIKSVIDLTSGAKSPVTIRLSGNCDEIGVQLDYLIRESTSILDAMETKIRPPDSWLGTHNEALFDRRPKIREEHERLQKLWKTLRDDLASLRPFKERLGTLRMLQRTGEAAARLSEHMKSARFGLQDSTNKIAAIVAGCNTDVETGRLQIPQKWAKEYPEQLRRRDESTQIIAQLTQQIEVLARDVQRRSESAELRGRADLPVLLYLSNLPPGWIELGPELGDEAIVRRLIELSRTLNTRVTPLDWPAGIPVATEAQPFETLEEHDIVPGFDTEPTENHPTE